VGDRHGGRFKGCNIYASFNCNKGQRNSSVKGKTLKISGVDHVQTPEFQAMQ
jgi:hypothetical protein